MCSSLVREGLENTSTVIARIPPTVKNHMTIDKCAEFDHERRTTSKKEVLMLGDKRSEVSFCG